MATTLERYVGTQSSVSEYYYGVRAIHPEVETFTGRSWSVPTQDFLHTHLQNVVFFPDGSLPGYEFLIYLRHHGYPSPLLDWSRSPFVAAHFAVPASLASTGRVAVYALLEFAGDPKTGSSSAPRITGLGHHVRSHPRHFLQQSEYTICTEKTAGRWFFASHKSVFDKNNVHQDMLWKFTFPASEALVVRQDLDRFNINDHSLFGTEEGLLSALAARELKDRRRER